MGDSTGIVRAQTLVANDRFVRARELKKQGRKIFGYLCCSVPLEMLSALDIVPVRLLGDPKELTTEADKHLENIMCSFIRSLFDVDLKGKFSFLDGFVAPHTCDNVTVSMNLWPFYIERDFYYYLNMPNVVNEVGEKLAEHSLSHFKKTLEGYTGKELTGEKLKQAISLYNKQRAMLRKLYEYRKEDGPRITGSEMKQVLIAIMSLPVEEGNVLLEEVIEEIEGRPDSRARGKRLLLYGPAMDNDFIELVEECGAEVVVDDACLGTRFFWNEVDETKEPFAALQHRYFNECRCPRTYKRPAEEGVAPGQTYDYDEDIELRMGHIGKYVREWSVDGVVAYILRFCDSHEFELPDIRDYLQKSDIPVLLLEGDYTLAKEQLKTRLQAFLEMLDQ